MSSQGINVILIVSDIQNQLIELLQFESLSNYFRSKLINYLSIPLEVIYNERKIKSLIQSHGKEVVLEVFFNNLEFNEN